ncbi:MAG: heme-binding protein [Acidobacteriota bacterium]
MQPRVLDRVVLAGALLFALGWTSRPHRTTVQLPARPVTTVLAPSDSPIGILTAADVQNIVANAALEAQRQGVSAVIAVTDKEQNILAVFRMDGAPRSLRFDGKPGGAAVNDGVHGLDGATLAPAGTAPGPGVIVAGPGIPDPTILAALSKAGTAAVFETSGNAFTTRSASFIIQEHFPPAVSFVSSGPLFGVQFSNLTCSDVKKTDPANRNLALPLGLSGDPGGIPLYKNGLPAGGIGVEADGIETVDFDPSRSRATPEELAALAGTRGFESPPAIRGDQILANGIRLPFANAAVPDPLPAETPAAGSYVFPPVDGSPTIFVPVTVAGLAATADPRFFPFRSSADPDGLSSAEVERIIGQALAQAYITRAAIRRPLGSFAQVNVTVVDAAGTVLGIARTPDAPVFGFDVSAQKARTAAFLSSDGAGAALSAAGFSEYTDRALADGLGLDGRVAFTDRANGFLSRPFFPDGIDGTAAGPFSRPFAEWSPFNDGLQIDLLRAALAGIVGGTHPLGPPCTDIPAIPNGIQIFPGSVPIYKNGALVGGVGVSGDGVDQDDIVATMGSAGFEAPPEIRSDRVFVRSVRLPWVKFPRHPNL